MNSLQHLHYNRNLLTRLYKITNPTLIFQKCLFSSSTNKGYKSAHAQKPTTKYKSIQSHNIKQSNKSPPGRKYEPSIINNKFDASHSKTFADNNQINKSKSYNKVDSIVNSIPKQINLMPEHFWYYSGKNERLLLEELHHTFPSATHHIVISAHETKHHTNNESYGVIKTIGHIPFEPKPIISFALQFIPNIKPITNTIDSGAMTSIRLCENIVKLLTPVILQHNNYFRLHILNANTDQVSDNRGFNTQTLRKLIVNQLNSDSNTKSIIEKYLLSDPHDELCLSPNDTYQIRVSSNRSGLKPNIRKQQKEHKEQLKFNLLVAESENGRYYENEIIIQIVIMKNNTEFYYSIANPMERKHYDTILSRLPYSNPVFPLYDIENNPNSTKLTSPPSVAYSKLIEAELRLGGEYKIKANQSVIDLGSNPGSITFTAAIRRANVFSVDRNIEKFNKNLLTNKYIHFIQDNAFEFNFPNEFLPIDWLICDIITTPDLTINIINNWILNNKPKCKYWLINIKFMNSNNDNKTTNILEVIKLLKDKIRNNIYYKQGSLVFELKRLNNNGNEICFYGYNKSVVSKSPTVKQYKDYIAANNITTNTNPTNLLDSR